MRISRRDALLSTIFGVSGLGLRALATGLPAALLVNPRRALADPSAMCAWASNAQFLIFSTSGNGDPLSGNVPGTYDTSFGDSTDSSPGDILHPQDPAMAKTPLTLSGRSYNAAAPWASLPQGALDRTCFFHLATRTPIHPKESEVMGLMGAVYNSKNTPDMLVSALCEQLAPCLGTIQTEPITVGAGSPSEALSYQGHTQPILSPLGLKAILTDPAGPLTSLEALRDRDLDSLNALFKETGNTAQRAFLDRYASSQTRVRALSQSLLSGLSALTDNSASAQITAAVTLILMKVAPSINIHIPFGGDNHSDPMLASETLQTVGTIAAGNKTSTGVDAIGQLLAALAAAGLQDQVTFASLNVFGRTMSLAHRQYEGRDHNGNHHCGLIVGKSIKGGVVGGIQKMAAKDGGDYGAMPINSATGAGDANGDINFDSTLGSFGKTVGAALGLPSASLDAMVNTGKVVTGALKS